LEVRRRKEERRTRGRGCGRKREEGGQDGGGREGQGKRRIFEVALKI